MTITRNLLTALLLVPRSWAFQVPNGNGLGVATFPRKLHLYSASEDPSFTAAVGQPSELPDSLQDGAQMAALACANLMAAQGPMGRCRVDFDTSAGDETFTLLKQSTEFMQHLVTSLCYLQFPDLKIQRQNEMMKVATAQAELAQVQAELDQLFKATASLDQNSDSTEEADPTLPLREKIDRLEAILQTGGRDPNVKYDGPICRVYFPDEGNAALARRDWLSPKGGGAPKVPPCVEFSSCGGVQVMDISRDELVFFFCPRASESDGVEKRLQQTEVLSPNLQLTVFVNPLLVDMGVTGFGMAGRLLRERLIDPLPCAYYLRTLQWGALTRVWPRDFSIWQEDGDAEGGYRLIRTQNTLPSNPEVEDIYDIENGNMQAKKSNGVLDQLGDFVNGMMRL